MINIFSTSILLVVIASSISCQSKRNESKNGKTKNDSTVSISVSEKLINNTLPLNKKKINLRTAKNIQVLSINKIINNDTTYKSLQDCKSWSLTAKQIISAIKHFTQMSSEERFLSYSYYPCEITGEIKIDEVQYKYWLEANATLTLINNNSSYYFGFTGKNYKRYFISGRLTDKELQQ